MQMGQRRAHYAQFLREIGDASGTGLPVSSEATETDFVPVTQPPPPPQPPQIPQPGGRAPAPYAHMTVLDLLAQPGRHRLKRLDPDHTDGSEW